jgi:hypothetical protein
MEIVWAEHIDWIDNGPSGSAGFSTPNLFPLPPGFNIYATSVLSTCSIVDQEIAQGFGGAASTFIFTWTVHNPDGTTTVVTPDGQPNAVFIDNCASISFALFVRGGHGSAQISIFTR